jgi:hypothetical protein
MDTQNPTPKRSCTKRDSAATPFKAANKATTEIQERIAPRIEHITSRFILEAALMRLIAYTSLRAFVPSPDFGRCTFILSIIER